MNALSLPTVSYESVPTRAEGSLALILLVDCDSENRFLLRTYLQLWGAHVIETENGTDALALIPQVHPDVILLNHRWFGDAGLTDLRTLRAHDGDHRVPIVMCSGNAERKWQDLAKTIGCDSYLLKPVLLDDLGIVLERFCKKDVVTSTPLPTCGSPELALHEPDLARGTPSRSARRKCLN